MLLPSKQILAKHLSVSVGTIQSAIRYIEDLGYVESKQKIGTIIKTSKEAVFKKLTSKRDLTVDFIRQYILEQNLKKDEILPDLEFVLENLKISSNTLRLALAFMVENKELKQIKTM
ncbi:MAG: GntR family transcriptional regulator [Candidatus Melainabacteria bacterium]|nr:MAG: GntR family transcriptional regulator [Candidatus Melainabacteria bacterium]